MHAKNNGWKKIRLLAATSLMAMNIALAQPMPVDNQNDYRRVPEL